MDPSEPRGQPETDTDSEAELKNCEANKHVDLQRCIEFFFPYLDGGARYMRVVGP
jgi:hypothetical protein